MTYLKKLSGERREPVVYFCLDYLIYVLQNCTLAFRAFSDPSVLDECDIDPATKETLYEDIKKRLTPQAVKIRAGKSTILCRFSN